MNTSWMAAGVVAFGVIARAVQWSRARRRPTDLGYVSHQWLAEYRVLHP